MTRRLRVVGSLGVCALAMAVACERQSSSPAAPSGVSPEAVSAGPDGSTLKVDAPKLVSAIGGVRIETDKATLVIQGASASYVQGQSFTYRVQLLTNAGTIIEDRTGPGLTYAMNSTLDFDTIYRWRARAELNAAFGPWSVTETFRSVDKKLGYIQGN